jgi:hypothetical protein
MPIAQPTFPTWTASALNLGLRQHQLRNMANTEKQGREQGTGVRGERQDVPPSVRTVVVRRHLVTPNTQSPSQPTCSAWTQKGWYKVRSHDEVGEGRTGQGIGRKARKH